MLTARKGLPGHMVYNKVRNALEMMLKTRGSADLAALGDILEDVDRVPPEFVNWLEDDKPLGEWYGVTTNERGDVVQLDLGRSTHS